MLAWAVVGADPRIATISALAASSSAMISVSECVLISRANTMSRLHTALSDRSSSSPGMSPPTDRTSWLAMAAVMQR